MAIENATQNLRDNNPSGLDKSLLLPSVREQMEQQNQNPVGGDSQKIFKVLNDIAGLIDDGNLAIVDALGDVNATLGLILSKTGNVRKYGALGALGNNMITRGIGQVGRFVTAPIRGASSLISGAANTITSIARKPLDIVSGAASTARNLIGAPFRGIGNIAKNMFTNKDQKKLVELAIEDLGIQKEQLEVQKETRDEVQALHKTYKDELKRRRRGNLDSLESRRDKRRGAGLMGAAAVGAAASRDKSSGGIGQMLKNLLGKAAAALGIGGATAYGGKKLFDKLKGKPTGDMDGDDKTKSNDKNNKDNNRDKGKSKID